MQQGITKEHDDNVLIIGRDEPISARHAPRWPGVSMVLSKGPLTDGGTPYAQCGCRQ